MSYTGLNGVCRQLRNEFHPLFYRGRKLLVPYCDLSEVLANLFPEDGISIAISRVAIIMTNDDAKLTVEIDLLSLLRATTRNPEVIWSFTWRNEVSQSQRAYPGRLTRCTVDLDPDRRYMSRPLHYNASNAGNSRA